MMTGLMLQKIISHWGEVDALGYLKSLKIFPADAPPIISTIIKLNSLQMFLKLSLMLSDAIKIDVYESRRLFKNC